MPIFRADHLDYRELPGRWSADPFTGVETEGVSARVVRLEPGVPRSPHRHPHSPEVIYVVRGTGHTWLDGTPTRVTPGDVVFVPTGVPHATVCERGSGMQLVCFFPHPDLAANGEELPGVVGL